MADENAPRDLLTQATTKDAQKKANERDAAAAGAERTKPKAKG